MHFNTDPSSDHCLSLVDASSRNLLYGLMVKSDTLRLVILSVFVTVCFFKPGNTKAQNGNTTQFAEIKGKVKDSVYHFVMSSATVAVYSTVDSSLVKFTMPNNLGEFTLPSVPIETPLKLVITQVGYRPFVKAFTIAKAKTSVDFGWIFMYQDDSISAGRDVVVTARAPVRMIGDTVEFNPDAFRLDSNATAEDLLRKLPGFTIWSDGDITYNGKQIKQLLVDGKPFLGGNDFTAATRNLPKGTLDKVQVYQQRDEKNPLDSTMFANLKLKENNKIRHFGKMSGGYGTNSHYAADGMLTAFDKKMQLGAAAGVNDVNKIATDMDMLIRNASYKGVGANTDYLSDFTKMGVNKTIPAGMKLQYDFIADPKYRKQNRLNADYFFSRNDVLNIGQVINNRFLSADSILSTLNDKESHNVSNNHNLNAAYLLNSNVSNLNISSSFSMGNTHASSINHSRQQTSREEVSHNISSSDNDSRSNSWKMSAEYDHLQGWNSGIQRIPTDFTLRYSFELWDNTVSGRTISSFMSTNDPSINKKYDRLYDQRNSNAFAQTIFTEYPNLSGLIFGKVSLGGIRLGINNTVGLNNGSASDRVRDLDTITVQYRSNNYLTNRSNSHTVDEKPAITLSKTFSKILTNRYNKYLSIKLNLQEQYYSFQHKATHKEQNLAYNYRRFLPELLLNYYNHQYGSYELTGFVAFQPSAFYPTISQLAPLIDSTDMLSISKGNLSLRPEFEKAYTAGVTIKGRKPKNPWEVNLHGVYKHLTDCFADSLIISDAGQSIHYIINLNEAENYATGVGYRKAFETKNNTYRLQFNYNRFLYKSPGYISGVRNLSNSTSVNFKTALDYAHLDKITLRLEEGVSCYTSKQYGFKDSRFKNKNVYTRFSGAIQWPKNLVWSSNITYNRSTSDNSVPENYTIWNSSLTYRFLHKNRGEIKFWAMDILHQNKGVINKTRDNVQTKGYTNTLQQYFMITLSYFPRKFEK